MLDWLRSGQYQEFIMGFFAQHTAAIVATIGVGQLTAAVLMSLRGSAVCLGLVGAIICLIAVAPLGSGTAFPSTLITACAGGSKLDKTDELKWGEPPRSIVEMTWRLLFRTSHYWKLPPWKLACKIPNVTPYVCSAPMRRRFTISTKIR